MFVEIHAHGTGHRHEESVAIVASAKVWEGPLSPGAAQSAPFRLTVPRLASAYTGTLLARRPRLAAVTLLSSQGSYHSGARRRPAAWLPLPVTPDARPVELVPLNVPLEGEASTSSAATGWGCAFIGSFVGISVLTAFVAAILWWMDMLNGLAMVVLAVAGGVFFLLSMILHGKRIWSEQRVGESSLSIYSQGGHQVIEVELAGYDRVRSARAAFAVQERATTTVGRRHETAVIRTATDRQVVAQHVVELTPDPSRRRLVGSLPTQLTAAWPPSFDDGYNAIDWLFELTVELQGAPNYVRSVPIQGAPGGEAFPTALALPE